MTINNSGASSIAAATRHVMSNGMVALIQRNPNSPTVSVRGDVGVGAANEPPEKNGLAVFTGAASYTHVAFCTLRLESTWMIVGQSAGVAAAMAVKEGLRVQSVPIGPLRARLRELKQVIDFVPGAPEVFEGGSGWPEF